MKIVMRSMIIKSLPCRQAGVKSINLCKSLPRRQAGVILTRYDIVKAHGGEINVMPADGEAGIKFLVAIPIKSIQ